jgi:hypothetical protein
VKTRFQSLRFRNAAWYRYAEESASLANAVMLKMGGKAGGDDDGTDPAVVGRCRLNQVDT